MSKNNYINNNNSSNSVTTKDYNYLYKKYKKKYLLVKQEIGGASITNISRVPPNILSARQRITRPIRLESTDVMENGEIWMFNSNLSSRNGRTCDIKKIFTSGHLGISFDTKDLSDNDKKIYGFGPDSNNWIDGCVEGSIKDDTQYFINFYITCSNINDPLYKIDIKYNPSKVKEFLETGSTYSDPFMGDKNFDSKFKSKTEYNNCITYVTNNIEPVIQIDDDLYIRMQSEYIDGIGMYPGGWISELISIYAKYGINIFKKKIY